MSMTNYLEDDLLNAALGGQTYIPPATVYIALSTTTPNDDGSNFTEPSGNGYARVAVTNNLTEWPDSAGSGQKSNANTILFPQASGGAWGTVTYAGIFDASSGGNLLWSGPLSSLQAIGDGDQYQFPVGQFVAGLD